MNEILHANIFFVIASIGTVFFLLLTSVILFHAIKIIKSIRRIVEKIELGSEVLASDVANLRSQIMSGGIVSRLFSLFVGSDFFGGRERPKRKTATGKKSRTRDEDDE